MLSCWLGDRVAGGGSITTAPGSAARREVARHATASSVAAVAGANRRMPNLEAMPIPARTGVFATEL
jgi:hypothetical protein